MVEPGYTPGGRVAPTPHANRFATCMIVVPPAAFWPITEVRGFKYVCLTSSTKTTTSSSRLFVQWLASRFASEGHLDPSCCEPELLYSVTRGCAQPRSEMKRPCVWQGACAGRLQGPGRAAYETECSARSSRVEQGRQHPCSSSSAKRSLTHASFQAASTSPVASAFAVT